MLEKSSYQKLRLSVGWLEDAMVRAGLVVERRQAGRLACLVGRKQDKPGSPSFAVFAKGGMK